MIIRVAKDGGDYSCIQEAIDSIPYDEKAEIHIGPGVFREKLFCQKREVMLVGDGIDSTVIDFDDCANQIMEDGSKRGTFRSYTAFFGGEKVTVRNMTIMNSAGDGREVGQAVAVYADSEICLFENVKLLGHQDTLFCAPLPRAERQKGGFTGPGMAKPRKLTRQYYRNCVIVGDVDFIFGGADAVFDDCEILVNNREGVDHRLDGDKVLVQNGDGLDRQDNAAKNTLDKDQINVSERFVNGYVTAACGLSDGLGFVFRNCIVRGIDGCAPGSVFLGRPWREQARTVFLDCIMDETIAPERFSGWGGITKDEPEAYYGEYGTKIADNISLVGGCGNDLKAIWRDIVEKKGNLPLADLSGKNHWVKDIDEEIVRDISQMADEVVRVCCVGA